MATPLISVVVPIHDVEPYLAACLDSVLAQGIDRLEVWCIDDGSTDASADIARRYADRDERIHLVQQANAGLGATRNRGVELARGTYLAFLDSDDLVPPHAYARMLSAAEASGAELVTGDFRRLTSVGERPSPRFSSIYHPARTGTHVTRDHVLLRDRIAPNKLFRRAFWEEHGLRFPVGVLHEDIPVVLRAHVLAHRVDVLDQSVYLWRIRQGADRSITQRRLEERALVDRVAAVADVSRFLAGRGLPDLKRAYDRLALTDDLELYASQLDRADDEYRARFAEVVGGFLDGVADDVLDDAPVLERVRWHLVRAGDTAGAAELARAHRIAPHGRPARWRVGGHLAADLPLEGIDTAVPRRLLRLDPEVTLVTGVTDVRVEGSRLVVDGFAALSHGDVVRPGDQKLSIWLAEVGGDGHLDVEVEAVDRPAASRAAPAVPERRGAGFRVRIDAAELAGRWASGTVRWRLHARVAAGRLTRSGPLGGIEAGPPRRPPATDVGGLRVAGRVDQEVLDVVVAARPVRLARVELVAGDTDPAGPAGPAGPADPAGPPGPAGEHRLRLTLTSGRDLTRLRLSAGADDELLVDLQPAGDERFTVELEPTAIAAALGVDVERTASLHAIDERGRAARLSAEDDVEHAHVAVAGGAVGVELSRYGYASVRCSPPLLRLERLETAAGTWLEGHLIGADAADLCAELRARDRHDPRTVDVEVVGDGLVRLHLDAGALTPRAGVHELDVRLGSDTEVSLRTRRWLTATLPVALPGGGLPGGALPTAVTDRSWNRIAVEVADDLSDDERSRADQRRLWAGATGTLPPAGRRREALRGLLPGARTGVAGGGRAGGVARVKAPRRELTPGLLVVARGGRSAFGDPRAVAEEVHALAPDLRIRFAVHQASSTPPPWAEAVAVGSRAWHEALATTAGIVTDGPLPPGFSRAAGQRVVRCWDGTPVRPIGRLGPGVRGAEQPADAYRAWSHVVAAGAAARATLAEAFHLDDPGSGIEMLEVGLPRHDPLSDPSARRTRRDQARIALGIPADAPVIVHLPTWVDGARHPGGGLRRLEELDLARTRDEVRRALTGHTGEADGAAPDTAPPDIAAPHPAAPDADALRLLVRAHPAVVDTYAELDGTSGVTDVRADTGVVDLLLAADVVLAHPSSVVLEATRIGVPVVLHDPTGYGLLAPLGPPLLDVVEVARPAAVTHDDGEVVAALTDVLTAGHPGRDVADGEQHEVIDPARHLEITTGRAAAAVAEVLLG
ncbi:MAG: glycosyltransferase [Nitriliruptoraceae bacterium]